MGLAEKLLVGSTPSQGSAGCGAFQRSSPTGGAAKGIPLKIRTVESILNAPSTSPFSVETIVGEAGGWLQEITARQRLHRKYFIIGRVKRLKGKVLLN